jgi:hypothetical protein
MPVPPHLSPIPKACHCPHLMLARGESRRDCITQPRVARHELPWVVARGIGSTIEGVASSTSCRGPARRSHTTRPPTGGPPKGRKLGSPRSMPPLRRTTTMHPARGHEQEVNDVEGPVCLIHRHRPRGGRRRHEFRVRHANLPPIRHVNIERVKWVRLVQLADFLYRHTSIVCVLVRRWAMPATTEGGPYHS